LLITSKEKTLSLRLNMSKEQQFAPTLLAWYGINGRELPWRKTTNPYFIWLSEIILQQTRVEQGMSYWHKFVEHYGTVEQLAAASEDAVLLLWQGLGYYSRARNMRVAAQQVVEMGGFPTTSKELQQLKGVGVYTASAIASFAFNEQVAVVDGNVYRVLARYFGIDAPIDDRKGKELFEQLAQRLLPHKDSAQYNQAIMDFGALQCVPASPDCMQCPLMETCDAFRNNKVATLPVKQKKVKKQNVLLNYVYLQYKGKTALMRRGKGDIWNGLWQPLLLEDLLLQPIEPSTECKTLQKHYPQAVQVVKELKHLLTHRTIFANMFFIRLEQEITLPEPYQWVKEDEIEQYAHSRLVELLLEKVRDYLETNN
jgi:A/G-specific adenine glycosylase